MISTAYLAASLVNILAANERLFETLSVKTSSQHRDEVHLLVNDGGQPKSFVLKVIGEGP